MVYTTSRRLSPRPPHCNVPHCNAPHCSARTPPAITAQPWPQVMVVACERWYSPDSTHAATGTAQAIHCPRTLEASSQSERYELAFCLVHEGHARDGGHWWVVDQTTTDPLILNEDNVELLTESSYDSYDVATQWVSAVYVLRANMLEEEGVLASLDEAAVTNELEYDWDATSGGDSGINSSHDGLGPDGPAALPLPGIGSYRCSTESCKRVFTNVQGCRFHESQVHGDRLLQCYSPSCEAIRFSPLLGYSSTTSPPMPETASRAVDVVWVATTCRLAASGRCGITTTITME